MIRAVGQSFLVAAVITCVSLLYATAGQAGGTAFLAVMAFAAFPAAEMRATALLLNIVAAGYATWRVYRKIGPDRKLLFQITIPSLFASFGGGLLILNGRGYFVLTGLLLLLAAGLLIFKRVADSGEAKSVHALPAALVGTGAGFTSGLTGVGGGVFLTPLLIALGWASPRRAAALSPPFILCNSILGLAGVLLGGQRLAPSTTLYAIAALVGAAVGTAIGLRWMSERGTRFALAAILLLAGIRLVFR
jgi:uncharacterized membrane protein YfcA